MNPLPKLATKDRIIDAVLVVSCGIVQAIALAFAAFATRDAFSALHAGHGLSTKTGIQLALSAGVAATCTLVSRYRAEALGQSYAISLRRELYSQIARLPKSRHEKRRVGALSLRFVGDLSAARLWFGRGLPDVLSSALVIPGAVAILHFLNPALAITGTISLSCSLLVLGLLAYHLAHRHRKLRRNRAKIAISMIERIAIAPELDLMGRTNRELRNLDKQGELLRYDALARRGRTASLQAVLQLGLALTGLFVILQAAQDDLAPATVAASLSVLALVSLPLQNLAGAWDYYCAWSVAREKAIRLLSEPIVTRFSTDYSTPPQVEVTGEIEGTPVSFKATAGSISTLTGTNAILVARCIAGLDTRQGLAVRFDGRSGAPKVAFVGDDHIGLQGSLRRSVTLMCPKRPNDRKVAKVMQAFGLSGMIQAPGGLDKRIAENGKGLTPFQTICIDLVRAVLGDADAVVIASIRWASCEHQQGKLIELLQKHSSATIILAEDPESFNLKKSSKVT